MNDDLVPQELHEVSIAFGRFQVAIICPVHIEPVVLDVLDDPEVVFRPRDPIAVPPLRLQ